MCDHEKMLPIYYISICKGIFSPSESFLLLKNLGGYLEPFSTERDIAFGWLRSRAGES